MRLLLLLATLALGLLATTGCAASGPPRQESLPALDSAATLPAYSPRFGRSRPIVAVVGENTFTELTDYVVPFGVLQASGVAEVVALATRPGPIQMFPALRIQPQATVAAFDARVPEGADYVIVPAVHHDQDPTLLAWVANQAAKGARIVGVCDGVWVLAHAGLLKGRRAVGHWYSFDALQGRFPDTAWVRDRRFLADGAVVTTTGVSASIPVSLALVEAIGGQQRARAVAHALGVTDWGPAHRSSDFKLSAPHLFTVATNWLAFWSHESIGIPVVAGIDEVTLALAADAYSRTYRSQAVSVSPAAAEVRTRGGLSIIPDRLAGDARPADRTLVLAEDTKPVAALDAALRDIGQAYGRRTSALVALQLEYPQP